MKGGKFIMIIEALILGWFLTFFDFNNMIIEVFQPFATIKLTDAHYYVGWLIIGIVCTVLKFVFE